MSLIERVVKNLGVFAQQDQHQIFKLMQKLGDNHSGEIIKVYHKILNVDKKYLTQEPNWNDTTYVARMIAIQSAVLATSKEAKISEVLENPPFYIEKHLNFFRDKYSQYFNKNKQEKTTFFQRISSTQIGDFGRPRIDSSFALVPNLIRANSISLTSAN